jgi:hypothetical protein
MTTKTTAPPTTITPLDPETLWFDSTPPRVLATVRAEDAARLVGLVARLAADAEEIGAAACRLPGMPPVDAAHHTFDPALAALAGEDVASWGLAPTLAAYLRRYAVAGEEQQAWSRVRSGYLTRLADSDLVRIVAQRIEAVTRQRDSLRALLERLDAAVGA